MLQLIPKLNFNKSFRYLIKIIHPHQAHGNIKRHERHYFQVLNARSKLKEYFSPSISSNKPVKATVLLSIFIQERILKNQIKLNKLVVQISILP